MLEFLPLEFLPLELLQMLQLFAFEQLCAFPDFLFSEINLSLLHRLAFNLFFAGSLFFAGNLFLGGDFFRLPGINRIELHQQRLDGTQRVCIPHHDQGVRSRVKTAIHLAIG